jgi:chromatin segregation and condensation protein Rec8/ScpA/Scc1 (kleisin family)
MAAELMLIKSKMLLPKQEGEEDPRQPLVDALLEHQRAIQAAAFLRQQSELYYDRFTKEPDKTMGYTSGFMRFHCCRRLF